MNEPPISAATAVLAAAPGPRNERALASQPALSLRIDRLVLEGIAFGVRDQARLQTALETELAALLAAQGPAVAQRQMGIALARLHAGDLRYEHTLDADRFGRAIARALHARIVR